MGRNQNLIKTILKNLQSDLDGIYDLQRIQIRITQIEFQKI